MLIPKRRPKPVPSTHGPHVTARHPNHVWHCDLTTVPTSFGFWVSWFPGALPQRWPFCWWVAVVVDHCSRRAMGFAVFEQQPSSVEVRMFLGRAIRSAGAAPEHLITDQGSQFTDDAFGRWYDRRGIRQSFGAVGKYGSIAVVERFIRSMKNECTRRFLVPYQRESMRRELALYLEWYNGHRPHEWLGSATPDEIYFDRARASESPRIEPRRHWPRGLPCASPQAEVRGKVGQVVELKLGYLSRRVHLPIVELKRAA